MEPRGGKRLEDEEEAELARLHASRLDPLDLAEHESRPKTTATGIEIAAALATGTECWLVDSRRSLICICNQEMFFDITQKFLILYISEKFACYSMLLQVIPQKECDVVSLL